MRSLIYFIGLTLFSANGFAEEYAETSQHNGEATTENSVYKSVDPSGRVVFSDKPTKNSELIETTPLNLHEGISPEDMGRSTRDPETSEPESTSYQLRMISPKPGQRLGPAQRSLNITIMLIPELHTSHRVVFLVDGKPAGKPTRALSKSIQMGLKMRGARTASARIIDQDGRIITSSASVPVQVIRPN